jgi:hypothetical protein
MSTKTEKFTTDENPSAARYQTARVVTVGQKSNTAGPIQNVRTVVTSAKQGSIELRYAPRGPIVNDASTVF